MALWPMTPLVLPELPSYFPQWVSWLVNGGGIVAGTALIPRAWRAVIRALTAPVLLEISRHENRVLRETLTNLLKDLEEAEKRVKRTAAGSGEESSGKSPAPTTTAPIATN